MKPYSFDCQDMETLHPSRRGPLRSPVVEWPNPNPSIHTDESQPHMQLGCNLIEFSWFQWARTQDLQVPVFAFDKQMTPMELRSQPAKTRLREGKIKSHTQTSPISTHTGLSPVMFTLVCVEPLLAQLKIHSLHRHNINALVTDCVNSSRFVTGLFYIWMGCTCKQSFLCHRLEWGTVLAIVKLK